MGAILVGASGCAVDRSLKVDSTPRDASVRLDGRAVGTTPVRIPFEAYGSRRVTIHKPGFRTRNVRIDLHAPWYGRFPLDVISEVLLPIGWEDRRALEVELVAGEEVVSIPTLRSVFERADILRHAGPEGPRDLPPVEVHELRRMEPSEPDPPAAAEEEGASTRNASAEPGPALAGTKRPKVRAAVER